MSATSHALRTPSNWRPNLVLMLQSDEQFRERRPALAARPKGLTTETKRRAFRFTPGVSTAPRDSGLLSSMRATFAPGSDDRLQSDPALEPSEVGGHTLLQRRLSLYG